MFPELHSLLMKYGDHSEADILDVWCVTANVDHIEGRQSRSIRLPDTQALVLYSVNGRDHAAVITRDEYHQAMQQAG